MGSLLSDFILFIVTVISYWQAYLTGGVITAGVALYERLSGRDLPKRVYVGLFIFTFLLASFFLAWRGERTSLQSAEQSLQSIKRELAREKDQNAPKLSGKIEDVIVKEGPGANEAQIFIYLALRNTGRQKSIAERFTLDVSSVGLQSKGSPAEFTKEMILSLDERKSNPKRQDSIEETTAKPIEDGHVVRGWLRFIVEVKREIIQQPGTQLTLSFNDILGQSYSTTYKMPQHPVSPSTQLR